MFIKNKSKVIIYDVVAIACVYIFLIINQTDILYMIYSGEYPLKDLAYSVYECLFPYKISTFVSICSVVTLIGMAPHVTIRWYDYIVGLCAGTVSLIGISLRKVETWYLIGGKCAVLSMMYVIGCVCLLVIVKGYILLFVAKIEGQNIDDNRAVTFLKSVTKNERKNFIFVFIVWSIWLVLRYPGGIQWDEAGQIEQVLTNSINTQHWPIFTTIYYGGIVLVGKSLLGSLKIGLFMAILFQIAYGAYVVTYAIHILRRCKLSTLYVVISLLIFSFNPIIARYMSTASKDSAYAVTILWFICLLIEIFIIDYNKTVPVKTYISLAICSLMLCLIRKNGSYTVLMFGMAVVLYKLYSRIRKKEWITSKCVRILMAVFLSGLILEQLLTNCLALNGIPKGPFREALSVPLQQTARLSRDYPSMVSDDDKYVINRVIDFEYIGTVYSPKTSDPVKDTYYGKGIKDFCAYSAVWMKYFIKVPSIYLQAFFHLNGDFLDFNSYFIELTKVDPDVIDSYEPWPIESKFRVFTDFYEKFPLIWPICNVGIQSWMCVYLMFIAIDRRNANIFLITLPAVVTLFFCLLGPTFVNQGIRYLLPVILSNPLVIGIIMNQNVNDLRHE